jgi:hypothetical protein
MKDEYVPYIIRRKIRRGKHTYPEYYKSYFSELRRYFLGDKIKSRFTRDELRDLLRKNNVEDARSRNVRNFLEFICREDIGICKHITREHGKAREKFVLAIDIKKYKGLQTYINKIGADDYILFGDPYSNLADDQTLENKVEN